MIIVGILGLIISTAVLLTCGVFWVLFGIVFWVLFGIVFWGVILAFMLLDLSGSYGMVALYILFIVLNLVLIYKIIRRKK
ncbi:hypothetical protein FDN64_07935 [Campylobacter coli]|nr:hypothetical protein [Campylobacter coli]EGC6668936.1 hypothetical protein [Campylobacter coli]EII3681109.1 hypothetical protein [Campylobacter coli]EIJ7409384.1 hypothetical protein [Campylobacter coli]EKH4974707.1 hypothetical protein [Campylobacter coli]